MDKDILKYLDKVGQYVQGASEKGFEVYVHGVFVESIVIGISGLLVTIISLSILFWLQYGYWVSKKNDMSNGFRNRFFNEISTSTVVGTVIFAVLSVLGIIVMCSNITGIFAPDYVAIKQIIDGIGGK
ncbi:hypothetical protein [Mammaliicoccus lentus]|uniref:Uncharacterized protein n=1 Tax=Mammaliicoccus lentus TaxID=42858 RepID=A0ABS6GT80_MAMLE|nr:hypothetical protein [Mammaliicoccus lentus]MBU6112528.1 hypothetical protein [Mammaliicoccus lentus]